MPLGINGLGDNNADLDKIGSEEFLVFAQKHRKSITVTWCYRDNQGSVTDCRFVLEYVVFPSSETLPAFAPNESIAEIIDAFVAREVGHIKNLVSLL